METLAAFVDNLIYFYTYILYTLVYGGISNKNIYSFINMHALLGYIGYE